jgi:hypothetical protein
MASISLLSTCAHEPRSRSRTSCARRGRRNLLCAPAGRKHKENISQAPDMSMVQVLMQRTMTGVIRSQSLAPKAAQ